LSPSSASTALSASFSVWLGPQSSLPAGAKRSSLTVAIGPAGADPPQLEQIVAARDPNAGVFSLIDDGILRHRRRLFFIAGDDAEIGEHLGLERAVGVLDLGLNLQAVRCRVERWRDEVDLPPKGPTG
jgi:hypothetical protein